MIKIAFLIIAHTDVEELLRLCKKLKSYGDAYIHVDIKADDSFMNRLHSGLSSMDGQYSTAVLKERHYVTWGGYSQVKSEESLLDSALNNTANYDRFIFLSGLDYPLCSKEQLQKYCTENTNKEFVRAYNITKGNDQSQLNKLRYYHFFRDVHLPLTSFIRRTLIFSSRFIIKLIGITRKPYFNANGVKWDIYMGSQWVGLTRPCALHVLDQLKNNRTMVKFFKKTYAPDELVIPTIILNSKFAKKEYITPNYNFAELAYLHYLTYKDYMWSFDENDYDQLMKSGKLFARKFISNKSEKLIERIDNTTDRNI